MDPSLLRYKTYTNAGRFIHEAEALQPYVKYLYSYMYYACMPSVIEDVIATTLDTQPPKQYPVAHDKSIFYRTYKSDAHWIGDSDSFIIVQHKGHKCKLPYYATYAVPSSERVYINPLKQMNEDIAAGIMDALFPTTTLDVRAMENIGSYEIPDVVWKILFHRYIDVLSLVKFATVSRKWQTMIDSIWKDKWHLHFPEKIPKTNSGAPGYNWKKYFFTTVRTVVEDKTMELYYEEQQRLQRAYYRRMACSCGKTCQDAAIAASGQALKSNKGFVGESLKLRSEQLVLPALRLLEFMKKVNSKREFSEIPILKGALARYVKFLELCKKFPEEELIPTVDIDVCWQAHLIRTKKYRNYCFEKFGQMIDRRIYIEEDEKLQKLEKTANLWKNQYDEEYEIPLCNLSTLRLEKRMSNPYLVTPEEIIKDRDWLDILNEQYVQKINFDSSKFLIPAIEQYEKFLHLTAKYPQQKDAPGPTHPVDLIWHCHQMHPLMYERDCFKIMNKLFDHDPWPHERLDPEEFECMRLADRQLWRDEFKEEQWVWT